YSKEIDAAFCFPCRFFDQSPDATFTETGFKDWKHALGKKGVISNHSTGKAHTEAMITWKEYEKRTRTGQTIGVQLDDMGSRVIYDNRKYVVTLMEGNRFCAQQGIAFRSHNEGEDALNPCNFKSLMALLS
uniref:Uncharacterized protein n=1 Tax=Amphimedon queenslandica TaxID=400682 RepID=A0A1X7TNM1_AMPQE